MTTRILLHPIFKHEHQNVYFELHRDSGEIKAHLVDESFRHIGGFSLFFICQDGISFDTSVGKWSDQTSNLEIFEVDDNRNERMKIVGIDII